jgi:hypothetical protein
VLGVVVLAWGGGLVVVCGGAVVVCDGVVVVVCGGVVVVLAAVAFSDVVEVLVSWSESPE